MTTRITITGNLTRDPELKSGPSGAAICSFGVAHNRRRFDRQAGEWLEDGTDFYDVTCFKLLAEDAAEALTRGAGVIITGELKSRTYEAREGGKRTAWEVVAEFVGTSVRKRREGQQGTSSSPAPAAADPWAAAPAQTEPPW